MSGGRKGFDPVAHALANPGRLGVVGPTVGDDIRRLIDHYGFEAVKAAVDERKPKAKRGPKKKNIWPELHRLCIEQHAREWLEGGDPFTAYSDNSIAEAFAKAHPGHSHSAQVRTARRRLTAKPYGRTWHTLASAFALSGDAYPYAAHIRTLEALCELQPEIHWEQVLEVKRGYIADYTRKHGPPAASLTMKQVEDGARNDLLRLLNTALSPEGEIGGQLPPARGMFGSKAPRAGGLFGLLSAHVKSGSSEK